MSVAPRMRPGFRAGRGMVLPAVAGVALAAALVFHAVSPPDRGSGLGPARRFLLGWRTDVDSWRVMQRALEQLRTRPAERLYQKVFFEDRQKYIYAPTALLFYLPFAPAGTATAPDASPILRWLCWALVVATLAMAAGILDRAEGFSPSAALAAGRRGTVVARYLAVAILGLTFYPLMKAYSLGQIQLWVNAFVVGALLAWLHGRKAVAGVLVGLAVLIKPQYALIVLWGLWRRDWRFLRGALAAIVPGCAISIALFGLRNHLDFLEVLSFISRHGDAYLANQSVNGLLNRVLQNGDSADWNPLVYPPYNPVVFAGTLASSAILTIAALVASRPAVVRAEDPLDGTNFCLMALSATLASPLVWEHHYGCLFGVFAWIVPRMLGRSDSPRPWIALAASYLLVGNFIGPVSRLSPGWLPAILQSYVLAGGLILLACLHLLRARDHGQKVRADFSPSLAS